MNIKYTYKNIIPKNLGAQTGDGPLGGWVDSFSRGRHFSKRTMMMKIAAAAKPGRMRGGWGNEMGIELTAWLTPSGNSAIMDPLKMVFMPN